MSCFMFKVKIIILKNDIRYFYMALISVSRRKDALRIHNSGHIFTFFSNVHELNSLHRKIVRSTLNLGSLMIMKKHGESNGLDMSRD